jgi:hypothetical protein
VLFAIVVYLGTFWVLWVSTRLFARRSYRTLHRASIAFGISFALCLPTIYLAHLVVPGSIWGVTEVSLMAAFLVIAIVAASRILRQDDSSSHASLT